MLPRQAKPGVLGIGGVFFKSGDPRKLADWYRDQLGVPVAEWGGAAFSNCDDRGGTTIWSPFAADTSYFKPSTQPFMLNFRVADLDATLAQLRAAGVDVDVRVEASEYGRFGWAMDPEGNRIELWQPPPTAVS